MLEGKTCKKCHRKAGNDRSYVALGKVGAHSRDVTNVVTNVIGNGSRVSGVVLGNTRLKLANKVRANVCRLSVDTAANTGKERDKRAAQAIARKYLYGGSIAISNKVDYEENAHKSQKTKSRNRETENGSATECGLECARHSLLLRLHGSSRVSLGRDRHTYPTCQC